MGLPGDHGRDVVRVAGNRVWIQLAHAERLVEQGVPLVQPDRIVRAIGAVEVEGHEVAVIRDSCHGRLDMFDA